MTREEAIKWFEALLHYLAKDEWNEEARAAANLAIEALRDMLKRREGCDTCMKGQAMFGDVLWAINKDGKAVININGEQANTVFHHCPMCGRKLEDEK